MISDTDAKRNIATHVNKLLDATGMSRSGLAQQINERPMNITRICQGLHVPNVVTMKKIAEVFGVSVDFLLSDE